jgi:adenylate kinase family enzyme
MALSRSSQAYIVADGLARTEAEALALTEKIALFREATALVLEVPEWECRRRLQLRGRNDDHESAVTSRMQIYEDQCTAIVETLKRSMETFYIEGIGSQDLVTDRILDVICPDMIDIFKD